eukprot:CAMPEP_0203923276 /NCGR_PEP_ID=MMETSP0359-20131031/63211_1 /ASSEMBLY_ACC=CAM_ASM_000338 /TAXON_ID=268821 /ORGANISM="Scrippsiella Hangoei, Strain SHTV-5" /LENGTH=223 /DNA_ID=CAMNT_0050851327 /DNA_START=55 /DNA_END=727 /DNA_ORIENTATION=+
MTGVPPDMLKDFVDEANEGGAASNARVWGGGSPVGKRVQQPETHRRDGGYHHSLAVRSLVRDAGAKFNCLHTIGNSPGTAAMKPDLAKALRGCRQRSPELYTGSGRHQNREPFGQRHAWPEVAQAPLPPEEGGDHPLLLALLLTDRMGLAAEACQEPAKSPPPPQPPAPLPPPPLSAGGAPAKDPAAEACPSASPAAHAPASMSEPRQPAPADRRSSATEPRA